jgi:hypothetical protein
MGSQANIVGTSLRLIAGAVLALGVAVALPGRLQHEPVLAAGEAQSERPGTDPVAAAPVLTVNVELAPARHPAGRSQLAALTPARLRAPPPQTAVPPAPADAPRPAGPSLQTPAPADPASQTLAKASAGDEPKICLTSPAPPTALTPAGKPMRLKFEPQLSHPAHDIAPQGPTPEAERRVRLSALLAGMFEK